MTNIDDVDFMQEHSVKDSATFLIDSAVRNRRYDPYPSDYTIEFSEPIRNVFGLDILDASIPGTMYNIDYHNNQLRYHVVQSIDAQNNEYAEAFRIMACSPMFMASTARMDSNVTAYLLSSEAWDTLNGVNSGGFSQRSSPTNDLVIAYRIMQANLSLMPQSIRTVLGVDVSGAPNYVWYSGTFWFQSRGVWYGTTDVDIASVLQITMMNSATDNICIMHTGSLVVTHDILITVSSYVEMSTPGSSFAELEQYEWRIDMITVNAELGNYNIASLASTLTEQMASRGFRVVSPSSSNLEKQNKYLFACRNAPFILDMQNSTMEEALGFDILPSAIPSSEQRSVQVYSMENEHLFGSVYNEANSEWRIYAPGIVNLMGVRYVTLRCPEIEDHLHGSRSYGMHSTGVGVFKLPSPNEVANLRFDFVNLIRKPFHPIGKISRLTIRFEFGKKNLLYDFKGINHQILLTMKFYSPPRVARSATSVLNPDYVPNYLTYVTRTMDYAERSDNDDDDDDDDVDHDDDENPKKIKHQQTQNDMLLRATRLAKSLKLEENKYDYSEY